jgi:hypothetical protein
MESPAPRQTTDAFLADNCWLFRLSRPSVLLIGAARDTDRAIQSIMAHGADAIAAWPEGATTTRPAGEALTLLVRNVASFDAQEQQRLHHWLGERSGAVRVIATSPRPLYELVERGQFLEPLYYRLNVVCLDAAASATV